MCHFNHNEKRDSMSMIAPAFIKAKQAFGPALKDKTNPAFKSKYADLSACLDAVDTALLEHGIALYQETFLDDSGVTVETVFLHESGEVIRGGKLHVPASKQDPQGYGSALSYARRYSLMAACGIAAEDDDGNAASTPKAKAKVPVDIKPYLKTMDDAKSAKALHAAYEAAWAATNGDQRIADHYDDILATHADKIKAAQHTDQPTTEGNPQ